MNTHKQPELKQFLISTSYWIAPIVLIVLFIPLSIVVNFFPASSNIFIDISVFILGIILLVLLFLKFLNLYFYRFYETEDTYVLSVRFVSFRSETIIPKTKIDSMYVKYTSILLFPIPILVFKMKDGTNIEVKNIKGPEISLYYIDLTKNISTTKDSK